MNHKNETHVFLKPKKLAALASWHDPLYAGTLCNTGNVLGIVMVWLGMW
jgi:hypothetical protein